MVFAAAAQRLIPNDGHSRNVQRIASGAIVFCYTFLGLALVASIFSSSSSSSSIGRYSDQAEAEEALKALGLSAPPDYSSFPPGALPPCVIPSDRFADLRLSSSFAYHCTPIRAKPTLRPLHSEVAVPVKGDRKLWSTGRWDEYTAETYREMVSKAKGIRGQDAFGLLTSLEQFQPVGREVMVGIASDSERIRIRAKAMAHWLANTDVLLIVSLPDEERGQKASELQAFLTSLHIKCKVITYAKSPVERYFNLVMDFAQSMSPYHKWFIWADDDTFFVSSGRLNALLSKHNPNEQIYIGNLSEDWFQIRAMDELFAFGGAGAIVSRALLDQLKRSFATCDAEWPRPFGDYQLARCIYGHSSARLTLDYSMHQGDLKGNVNGFFESGRVFTTLHHWNSWWFNVDVTQYVTVASKTTAASVGERFEFQSPSRGKRAVLTNGFSIVEYPESVYKTIDFTKMERTWDNRTEGDRFFFDFTLGPLRYPLQEGVDRFTHLMERSWIDLTHPTRPVHQVYVQRNAINGNQDDVIHLMWI